MYKYARMHSLDVADRFAAYLVRLGCVIAGRSTDGGHYEVVYTKPDFDPAVDKDLGPARDDTSDMLDLQHEDQERHGWEQT